MEKFTDIKKARRAADEANAAHRGKGYFYVYSIHDAHLVEFSEDKREPPSCKVSAEHVAYCTRKV